MKIFLTGASGILGSDIASQLQIAGHEVLPFDSTNINLKSYTDVAKKVIDFSPDVIIHCAAMTNVDLCEDDKEAANAINITGSKNIAKASKRVEAKMIYISSCGVYGTGKDVPYTELDDVSPQTYHHYTKLQGEIQVKKYSKDFLIIRPGWLFGGTVQHKKNFVEARRKEAERSPVIKSAIDKIGSPTYTLDLAKQIVFLMENNFKGIFNVVSEGCASRFNYVSEIVKLFAIKCVVEPVNSNAFPRKANMPDNECLENAHLNLVRANKMRFWKDALSEYINSINKL